MAPQATLPGMRGVLGTYNCGHGTTHRLPSEPVTIYKIGGAGFIGGCECGAGPVGESSPVVLGDHVVLLGVKGLGPGLWLALAERAEWFPGSDPDSEPVGGGTSPRERRAERRSKYHEEIQESSRK